MHRTGFQGKRQDAGENRVFGITRAFHVGDRCVECGECERACPIGLPILGQTQKIIKTIEKLAGEYEAGVNPEDENFLGTFDLDDKDEFM
jgi:ferredoxin